MDRIVPTFRSFYHYYQSKNRWWLPVFAGCLYPFALPPFNREFSIIFSPFPFLSFIVIVPLLVFSVQKQFRRALLHVFLFGFIAAMGQYYWLIYDNMEGVWYLVIIGLIFASSVVATLYLIAGMLFRIGYHLLPGFYIVVFPAAWVLIDFSRTLGELAFPWMFIGYAITPVLPLAQLCAVTGVWGWTWLVVLGNVLVFSFIKAVVQRRRLKIAAVSIGMFIATCICIGLWGTFRLCNFSANRGDYARIALLQSNLDQFHWGNRSLDTAFSIAESLSFAAAREKPELLIMSESALLCYVARRQSYAERVLSWSNATGIPLIFGTIDWENAPAGSPYDYYVYNAAFLARPDAKEFETYYKIKLVPFSEAIPFEGAFPILSRVNLGEADFHAGADSTVFILENGLRPAPFICYETNFPSFVQQRMKKGMNLMVNVTNDGWFGKSSGPYHHAIMARTRAIENGVTLARAANSGISMFVDPVGRILGHTGLYTREILVKDVPVYNIPTLYKKFGDWFVVVCAFATVAGLAGACVAAVKFKKTT